MSPQFKFETVLRIVRGLSWVYDKYGVMHRDIKPSNILFDSRGLSYITDWGLARPISNAFSFMESNLRVSDITRESRTQIGSFVGTLTYASPEQIVGAEDLDHRSDIYSLGCVMYELEKGNPPFFHEDPLKLVQQHLYESHQKLGGIFSRTVVSHIKLTEIF